MSDDQVKSDTDQEKSLDLKDQPPITTHHELNLNGQTYAYTVNTGMMPLKNDQEEIEAEIFFMAYTLDREGADTGDRPLIFVFNGGPGSASVWLHLGTCGPKRVQMQDEGWLPRPPFKLVPNENTWLDLADLVFIDPVGTGYSRAAKSDDNKKYWNPEGDLTAVAEFIRLYLTRHERWGSPLFLAGESYGTMRAAGLAGKLVDMGIALNGIVLISTVLNLQTLRFGRGNDLPFYVYLPSYAATAWYHGKLPDDLQHLPLDELIAEVEDWTENTYAIALMKGDRLSDRERAAVVSDLARYTGLDEEFVERANLRIHQARFCKELLRDEGRTVGRLDSRFKGRDADNAGEFPQYDPSLNDIIPPYTSLMNNYVRRELNFKSDRIYEVLSFNVNENWEWDRGVYPDTSEALRSAIAKNPFTHVLIARGYYDLATPHFAAQYSFDHMDFPRDLRDQIHYSDYEAGHMLYLEVGALGQLKADVAEFIQQAIASESLTAGAD